MGFQANILLNVMMYVADLMYYILCKFRLVQKKDRMMVMIQAKELKVIRGMWWYPWSAAVPENGAERKKIQSQVDIKNYAL